MALFDVVGARMKALGTDVYVARPPVENLCVTRATLMGAVRRCRHQREEARRAGSAANRDVHDRITTTPKTGSTVHANAVGTERERRVLCMCVSACGEHGRRTSRRQDLVPHRHALTLRRRSEALPHGR